MNQLRRVDDSMSLLRTVIDEAVDPDYAEVARRRRPRHSPVWFAMVVVLIGALFVVALIHNTRAKPALAQERQQLITRLQNQQQQQDRLRESIRTRQRDIQRLERDTLGSDQQSRHLSDALSATELQAAAVPVSGPGVEIVVDDAADGSPDGWVVDTDLQSLANGLWESGAEAITINGHRLTSRSAIRGAGQAITVDYRSISRPYVVRAIGDPATLGPRFHESTGGQWWAMVQDRYGLSFTMETRDHLVLEAGTGNTLRHAKEHT